MIQNYNEPERHRNEYQEPVVVFSSDEDADKNNSFNEERKLELQSRHLGPFMTPDMTTGQRFEPQKFVMDAWNR